jgi:ribonuclease III
MKRDFSSNLTKLTGLSVFDPRVYIPALTHKSREKAENRNYERLEFLGDAVINLIGARYLFEQRPHASVGELTQMRSRIVNGKCLARIAKTIGIPDHIRLSKRASERGVHTRDRICEDVLEALVGAIYVDMGFSACQEFFIDILRSSGALNSVDMDTNYKDILNRHTHVSGDPSPRYVTRLCCDRNNQFLTTVFVGNDVVATSYGTSKKQSEQDAARVALQMLAVTMQAPEAPEAPEAHEAPKAHEAPQVPHAPPKVPQAQAPQAKAPQAKAPPKVPHAPPNVPQAQAPQAMAPPNVPHAQAPPNVPHAQAPPNVPQSQAPPNRLINTGPIEISNWNLHCKALL